MPPDPIRAADTRAWLARALDDLRGADIDLAATPPLLGDATFHCQQAVEKALKAFLTWHDRPFRKTHDLVELGAQCVAIDASLEPLLQPAAPLTEYAWRYRYPGEPAEPTEAEVGSGLARARSAVAAILDRLPSDARP
ncbi:MAG TPA: DNA-binding protein [Candidatus Rokubacteria bacterium]|nr:DNA-binding protein [Candidatus Rokubacteria bacterium]